MSSIDARYPAASGGGSYSPPDIKPQQKTSLPAPPDDPDAFQYNRCATGWRFLSTIHGILSIVTFITIICVIISAGVVNSQLTNAADSSGSPTDVKLSATKTRNAIIVFAVFGLILILFDAIVHVTGWIKRMARVFDTLFIIVMLILAGIYLILGCCAAAWEQKMRDTVGFDTGELPHKGAAASAAFFLFVTMAAILVNFILRLVVKPSQSSNP